MTQTDTTHVDSERRIPTFSERHGRTVVMRASIFLAVALLLTIPSTFTREQSLTDRRRQEYKQGGAPRLGTTPMELAANMLGGMKGMIVNVFWLMAMNAEEKGRLNEVNTYYDLITRLQPRFVKFWETWGMTTRAMANSAPNTALRWFWLKRTINIYREGQKFNNGSADLYHQESFIYRTDFALNDPNAEELRARLNNDAGLTDILTKKGIHFNEDTVAEWLSLEDINRILNDPDNLAQPKKPDRLTFYYTARARTRQALIGGDYVRPSRRRRMIAGLDPEPVGTAAPLAARPPGWIDYAAIDALPADSLGFFNEKRGERTQVWRNFMDVDEFLKDDKNTIKNVPVLNELKRDYAEHFIFLERKWAILDDSYSVTLGIASALSSEPELAENMARASDFYSRRSKARGDLMNALFDFLSKKLPLILDAKTQSVYMALSRSGKIGYICRFYQNRRRRVFDEQRRMGARIVPRLLEDLDFRAAESFEGKE